MESFLDGAFYYPDRKHGARSYLVRGVLLGEEVLLAIEVADVMTIKTVFPRGARPVATFAVPCGRAFAMAIGLTIGDGWSVHA